MAGAACLSTGINGIADHPLPARVPLHGCVLSRALAMHAFPLPGYCRACCIILNSYQHSLQFHIFYLINFAIHIVHSKTTGAPARQEVRGRRIAAGSDQSRKEFRGRKVDIGSARDPGTWGDNPMPLVCSMGDGYNASLLDTTGIFATPLRISFATLQEDLRASWW